MPSRIVIGVLVALCWAAAAASFAAEPYVPSPSQLLGPLFVHVQMAALGGGEYPVQDGFGWTNGVTRGLLQLYPDLRSASAH